MGSNRSGAGSESLRGEGVGVRPPKGGGGGGRVWGLERLEEKFLGMLSELAIKRMESCRDVNR